MALAFDPSNVDGKRVSPNMGHAGLWLDVTYHIVSMLVYFERADGQSDSWCCHGLTSRCKDVALTFLLGLGWGRGLGLMLEAPSGP